MYGMIFKQGQVNSALTLQFTVSAVQVNFLPSYQ
ncbi:hypothetical protein LDFHOB_07340 [Candidatus Electronema aureum]